MLHDCWLLSARRLLDFRGSSTRKSFFFDIVDIEIDLLGLIAGARLRSRGWTRYWFDNPRLFRARRWRRWTARWFHFWSWAARLSLRSWAGWLSLFLVFLSFCGTFLFLLLFLTIIFLFIRILLRCNKFLSLFMSLMFGFAISFALLYSLCLGLLNLFSLLISLDLGLFGLLLLFRLISLLLDFLGFVVLGLFGLFFGFICLFLEIIC